MNAAITRESRNTYGKEPWKVSISHSRTHTLTTVAKKAYLYTKQLDNGGADTIAQQGFVLGDTREELGVAR